MNLFENDTKFTELDQEARSWIGTPYHHMGETKGGIDCTKYVAYIYVKLGILGKIEAGIYYSKDWCNCGKKEVVIDSFREHAEKYLADRLCILHIPKAKLDVPYRGDVLLFSLVPTGLSNHTAIFLGTGDYQDELIHCIDRDGVGIYRLTDQWREQMTGVLRVKVHSGEGGVKWVSV